MSTSDDIACRWGRSEWMPAADASDEVQDYCIREGGRFYMLPVEGFAYVFDDDSVLLNREGRWYTENDRGRDLWLDTIIEELTEEQ